MATLTFTELSSSLGNISRQPAIRQLLLLIGIAASVAFGVGVVLWSQDGDYAPLFGDMTATDTAEVARLLETNGIEYTVNKRNGLVSVPADRVHDVRLKLASEGLPRGDGRGFDILYKQQEIGVSSFIEKARYDRALEQELSESISSLDSVRSARVHLAIPKASAFIRNGSKAEASVLVNLYPGRELTDSQLAGVAHLVASSVPGLEAEQVSVVDNKGKLLSQSRGDTTEFGYNKEQFVFTRQLEETYVSRIGEILTPILGVNRFRAQVAANIDFTVKEETSENYSPETKVRSEQLIQENATTPGVGGIPGTLSNTPPDDATVTETPPGQEGLETTKTPARSSKKEIRNYELDRTISHVRETPGNLQRLSVAVVVDYRSAVNDAGEAITEPLPQDELDRVTGLVKEAVGFDAERGDTVNVVNASFVPVPVPEELPGPSFLEQPWVWQVARLALAGLAIFFLLFAVLKPLVSSMAKHQGGGGGMLPAGGQGLQPMGNEAMYGEEQVSLSGQQQAPGLPGANYQQQLHMARAMVNENPERVAHVVKSWVSDDG